MATVTAKTRTIHTRTITGILHEPYTDGRDRYQAVWHVQPKDGNQYEIVDLRSGHRVLSGLFPDADAAEAAGVAAMEAHDASVGGA